MPQTPNDQVEAVKVKVKAQEAAGEERVEPMPTETQAPLVDEKARILAIIEEMRPIYRAPDQLSLLDEVVTRINA